MGNERIFYKLILFFSFMTAQAGLMWYLAQKLPKEDPDFIELLHGTQK
jgi:hypothetical protein